MKNFLIKLVRKILSRFGLSVNSSSFVTRSEQIFRNFEYDLVFLGYLEAQLRRKILPLFQKSSSQIRQDIFVLSEVNFKHGGFFVEFGATDGVELSNTLLLEREYNWKGILVEPGKVWLNKLKKNRPLSAIDTRCVWSKTGELLTFKQTNDPVYSTVKEFTHLKSHFSARRKGKEFKVKSVSLNDLLSEYNAPNEIDYLSIDTEGSEFEILKSVDFKKYKFSVITVEHNFEDQRNLIFELLTSHGYKRKYENVSQFDDWYVRV